MHAVDMDYLLDQIDLGSHDHGYYGFARPLRNGSAYFS